MWKKPVIRYGIEVIMQLYGSLSQLTMRRGGAVPWWLSGGISAANCVAAYQPKGAASYAASKINLANPGTEDAVDGVAPPWDAASGWIGQAGKYIIGCTMRPIRTVICRFMNSSVGGGTIRVLLGRYTYDGMVISINAHGNYDFTNWSVGGIAAGGASTSGVLAIADNVAYVNGVPVITNLLVGSRESSNAKSLMLMTSNWGAMQYPFNGSACAYVYYNTTLTAPQVLAVSTAMAAL